MPPLEVEPSLPNSQEALWQIVVFLLRQLGGSIALSPEEQFRIRDIDITKVRMYRTADPENLIIKVEE